MLRDLLLSGISFLPFYAAPGEGSGGTEGGDQETGEGGAPEGGDQGAEGDASEGGDQGIGEGGSPPVEAKSEAKADWRDREIDRKHRQLQEERRARQELERRLADMQAIEERAGGDKTPPTAVKTFTPEDVQREASKLVAQSEYDKACNATFAAGKDTYKDKWDGALSTLQKLGGIDLETMQGVLASDDPAKVLYELGTNPDQYHEIMDPSVPAAKRLARITKLGLPVAAEAPRKKVSEAPPPVDGAARRASSGGSDLRDDLSDEEWYARRVRQKEQRWKDKQAGRIPA